MTPATCQCPTCNRPNALHRMTCVYCGASLPEGGQAPPPPTQTSRELSPEMGELVRRALQGKASPSEIRRAIQEKGTGSVAPATPGGTPNTGTPPHPKAPSPPQVRGDAPTVVIARGRDTQPLPPPEVSPPELPRKGRPPEVETSPHPTSKVAELARDLQLNWERGDFPAAERSLTQLVAGLKEVQALLVQRRVSSPLVLAPPSLPVAGVTLPAEGSSPIPLSPHLPPQSPARIPAVVLPPIRTPYMLVVSGGGQESDAADLARALGVDGVTARLSLRSNHSRIALRGTDPQDLRRRGEELARLTTLRATVVSRSQLEGVTDPSCLVSIQEDGAWRLSSSPAWLMRDDVLVEMGEVLPPPDFVLAVPGEVSVRRFRQSDSNSRLTRLSRDEPQDLGEHRVPVLDLYHEGGNVRLVVGVTQFRGLTGYDKNSAMRSLKLLIDALPECYPGIMVEGRRVASPGHSRPTSQEPVSSVDGWSTWEEHTRICWLHFVAGRESR